MIIERLTSVASLPPLGAIGSILLQLKHLLRLPLEEDFTDDDANLALYLSAAETYTDAVTSRTLRESEFLLSYELDDLQTRSCLDYFRITVTPVVSVDSVTVKAKLTDGSTEVQTLVLDTDYSTSGFLSLTPEITLSDAYLLPDLALVRYPIEVLLVSGDSDGSLNPVHLLCVLQAAAYYYRNPEAVGASIEKDGDGRVFWSHVDMLTRSIL